MVNFVYTFGDRETGEAALVDPAYRPGELIDLVEGDDMRVSAVFATHYHPDHVGGNLGGRAQIAGIVELLERIDVPIHVQADEVEWSRNARASAKTPSSLTAPATWLRWATSKFR